MKHGGKREGAGRPRGVKAGTKRERLDKALGKDEVSPLDYMLRVLNNKASSPERKMWAAEKAAPYLHPRLASKEHTIKGDETKPVKINLCHNPEKS